MFYDYVCDECHAEREIKGSPKAKIPVRLHCIKCASNGKNNWMRRNWKGSAKIHIPDSFKATSETNADGPTNLSHLQNIMKHSHPSGREGPIYHQVPEMHIHKAE